jgi:hypothetical protein
VHCCDLKLYLPGGGGHSSVVVHVPSMYVVLHYIPSSAKNNRNPKILTCTPPPQGFAILLAAIRNHCPDQWLLSGFCTLPGPRHVPGRIWDWRSLPLHHSPECTIRSSPAVVTVWSWWGLFLSLSELISEVRAGDGSAKAPEAAVESGLVTGFSSEAWSTWVWCWRHLRALHRKLSCSTWGACEMPHFMLPEFLPNPKLKITPGV